MMMEMISKKRNYIEAFWEDYELKNLYGSLKICKYNDKNKKINKFQFNYLN